MSSLRTHFASIGTALVLALAGATVLLLPVTASGQIGPGASVTVCQVTGSAGAPNFAQVEVSVDSLAAYLNQFPGSFVGSCPASGGGNGGNPPLNAAVTICRVSGEARAPVLTEVLVAADQVAVYLNQNPGSFAGSCPAATPGGNSSTGGTSPVNAAVTVCNVTGSANAPRVAQVSLAVDRVAAYLNQNPGSFVGACPGDRTTVTQGPGRILGIPAGAALSICSVTGKAGVLRFAQVNVAIDRVAAFLNQNPGSFVGLCPGAGDPNGTLGNEPLGYVTICRITGNVANPLAPVTVRVDQLEAYLAQAGTIMPAPTAGCPRAGTGGGGGGGGNQPPTTTPPGSTTSVSVSTTPNTVVTARGAGVDQAARSNKAGKARLKITPKKAGIVTVRATAGRVVKRIGVAKPTRSGLNLTG